MGRISDLRDYGERFRNELRRLGAYRPDVPAGPFLRLIREFMELSMPAEQAAAWAAVGIGPSVVGLLTARNIAPSGWRAYADRYAQARQLNGPDLALEWILAGIEVDDALAWANTGHLPAEAQPLIEQGVTPHMVGAADEAAVTAHGGPAEHLRAAVRHLAEQHPGMVIDPDLADRLGLDEPGPDPR